MPTGNTQQQINYGATANDGQGDPLRTAFIKTDDNFDNIWLAGPAGSNVRITNNTIGVIDTNGNLILSPNGVGVIQTNNNVVPRANRTYDLGSANLQYRTVYANSAALQTLSVSGNLTVSGNIINTGNIVTDTLTIQLANTTTTANAANGAGITVGASDNIATILYNSASNVWTTNIGLSATGNITSPYFFGNGSQLTGIVSSYGNANVVANLAALGTNPISTTGNVSAGNVLTSAQVIATGVVQSGTGLSTGGYLSVNGTTDLHNTTVTGNISASGNITAGNVAITGGSLTWANSGIVQTSSVDLSITGDGQVTVRSLDGTYQWTFEPNGVLTAPGNIGTTGNITGGYILGNGSQLTGIASSYGNANVANYLPTFSGNISAGNITTTGNISGAYVKGNGSELTNLPAPTVTQDITSNGAMSIMTYDGVIKYVNYATVEPVSGNIAGGNISAIGNVAGNFFLGNGSQLTGISTANTGNVTFNDVNVIGDGNLNLQPNSASNEYLDIYLTGAADIHVAAGGSGGNLILGTDEEANVAVLQGGNVAIQAGNVGGTKTWNFDTAGNLTLPLNSVVYETNIPDGGLSGSAIALKPTGGTNADQELLIYPTVNDANHLHLTTGNLYNTELFLGDDNLYVKLANTGNIVVNSNNGSGNTAQWTFGTDGNLILAGGDSVIQSIANSSLDPNISNVSTMVFTPDQNYTSQALVIDPTGPSHIHLRAPGANIDEPDANIFLGGEDSSFEVGYYNGSAPNVYIHSGGNTWTFGTDGTTTFPAGNITSNTSLQFTTTFANVKTVEYQTAGVWDLYVEDSITGSNTASSRLNVSFKDNLIDKPQVYIENTKESDGIALRWTFDENGILVFPRDVAGNTDPILTIVGGANPSISAIDASLAGPANLGISALTTIFSGFTGDEIKIYPDDGEISSTANLQIWANSGGNTEYSWTFDDTGNLTLPGNTFAVNYANGTQVSLGGGGNANTGNVTFSDQVVIGTGTNDGGGGLYLAPGNASIANSAVQYFRVRGGDVPTHIHLDTGNNDYYDQYFGDDAQYVKLANIGNVVIGAANVSSSAQWTFGTDGNLTTPSNLVIGPGAGSGSRIFQYDEGLEIVGEGANSVVQLGWTANTSAPDSVTTIAMNYPGGGEGNVLIAVGNNATTVNYWLFDNTGNLRLPGNTFAVNYANGTAVSLGGSSYGNANVVANLAALGSNPISTTGNITAGNLIGNISITSNVVGTQANVTLVAGSYSTVFDNTGNLTLPGNTFAVNYANNTPVDVVTRVEGAWTVTAGTNNYSFTVPINNTYQLWINGNIPNGIIVYNATVSVSNTNVPAIGYQYAWNYTGGGNILAFTSIPDQIIGTAGAISNAQPAVANTNVFSFGINNTSGNTVTVNYGWIQIS
jgi:hypothetical protein